MGSFSSLFLKIVRFHLSSFEFLFICDAIKGRIDYSSYLAIKLSNGNMAAINLEDFIIVWLDASIRINDISFAKRQSQLRAYVNCIKIFDRPDECFEYMSAICLERIFFITSGSLGENFVPQVHNLEQVTFIYIFCTDKEKHDQWSKAYIKVRGVFNNDNQLLMQLRSDLQMHIKIMTPMNIFDTKEKSLQDLNVEQSSFIWFQLLIEVLLRFPQTENAKDEMVEECRINYHDNSSALQDIAEFQSKYDANQAIYWYTADSFLYRLFNKAFRIQDIDVIFRYRYFLIDLCTQLYALNTSQLSTASASFTVYRGQGMYIEELQKLQQGIGHLISINTFFSTSTTCDVASEFSGCGERRPLIESVIFEIKIDPVSYRRPFARIGDLSFNKDEDEVLFAMGTVFRIESVELYTDDIWLVKLTLSDEVDKKLTDLLDHYMLTIGEQSSILVLGLFLSKMGQFEKAQRFYKRLLGELSSGDSTLGVVLNNLGETYRQQGNMDQAMHYFQRALAINDERTYSYLWRAIAYSNMASIFQSREELDQALVYYREALNVLRTKVTADISQETDELLDNTRATIFHNIGNVYLAQGQYDLALACYKDVLEMEKNLPENHPTLATTYSNLGCLYSRVKNGQLALDNHRKALSIQLVSLPSDHPQLASTYAAIGTLLLDSKDYDAALSHFTKAEQILGLSNVSTDYVALKTIYIALAMLYQTKRMFQLAISTYEKHFELLQRNPSYQDHYNIAECAFRIGRLMTQHNKISEGRDYQQRAAENAMLLPPSSRRHELLSKIIEELQRTGNHTLALEYYQRMFHEELTGGNKNPLLCAGLHNELGTLFEDQNDYVSALRHYQIALQLLLENNITRDNLVATCFYNIGMVHKKLKSTKEACTSFLSALANLSSANQDQQLTIRIVLNLGHVHYDISQWKEAEEYYENARELSFNMFADPNHSWVTKCQEYLNLTKSKLCDYQQSTDNK